MDEAIRVLIQIVALYTLVAELREGDSLGFDIRRCPFAGMAAILANPVLDPHDRTRHQKLNRSNGPYALRPLWE